MITSTSNPLVKRVRRLRRRRARDEEGAFFADGIAVVVEAVRCDAPIQRLVVAPELLTSETGGAAVAAASARGVDVAEVSAEVYAVLSERDRPSGLGAVVEASHATLAQVAAQGSSPVVALDRLADPGNLGTIVRTADAAGCGGIVLCGAGADPFAPGAVRASMGTLFRLPIAHVAAVAEAAAWARSAGRPVVATSAHAPTPVWEADLPGGGLYLFGSEQRGLDPEVLDAADQAVSLPMAGGASSLNVAVAAGIVLYEVARRTRSS